MEAPQSLKRLTLRPVSARFADAFVIMRDAFIAVSENEWKGGAVIAIPTPPLLSLRTTLMHRRH
jgi:hypothetical protein